MTGAELIKAAQAGDFAHLAPRDSAEDTLQLYLDCNHLARLGGAPCVICESPDHAAEDCPDGAAWDALEQDPADREF
jgi:hypothetical protein